MTSDARPEDEPARAIAAEFYWLAETMLPGDDRFPSAGTVGAQARLVGRLAAAGGEAALDRVMSAIGAAGGPLAGIDQSARVTVLSAFEQAEPAMFAELRRLLYLAYYEAPLVVRAIRASGIRHNLTPLPEGYVMAPFDPATDAPRHVRGCWKRTDEVLRVDLSTVPHARS